MNAETFTVRIAEGTKLQSSFLTQDPTPISIAEASAVKTSDFETLYAVEGIVESITSTANGQGYIIDPSTGKKLMFFHLGTDSSMFNTYDPSSGIYPDADPGFKGLGLAVGDKIIVHGIMYVYKSTPEIVGWCQDIVKKEAVDYDLTSEITVPEGIEAGLSYFDETGAKVTKIPADRTLTLKVEAPVGCYVKSLKFGGKTVTPNEDGTYTVKSIIGINKAVVEIAEASKYVVEITNGTIDKGTVTVVDSDGHTGTTTVDGVTTIESYEGALITVTVNPTNESFVLNKLTLDGEDVMDRVVERKLTFPVSKAHTLNVEFVQNKVYGIALKPAYEKGNVSVDKNSANLNEKVTVTMTPDRSETSVITVSSVLINKLKADGTVLGTDDLTAAVVETETKGVFEVTFVATDITDLASYEIVVVFTEMIEKTSVYKICEDKYNSSISGSIPTNFGQFIQTGTDIVSGVATSGSCAWSAGNPLKFGTSGTPATKLTLSLATKVSKVSVRACSWSKETAVITVNGVSLTLNKGTGSASDYQTLEFSVDPSDRIEISNSGGRYLISQLEFNYLAVPAAPHAVYSTVYGSGTVLLNDENVVDQIKMLDDGEQAVFTITPAEYYYIEKFTINDESMLDQLSENAGYYTYTLDAVYEDLLVDVKFAEMSKYSFTIQANDTSMGTATMSVDGTAATDILTDVYQNTPITINVTPQSGYVFSSLKLIDYSTSEPVPATFVKVTDTQYIFTPDFTADGDYEILAVFAAESEIEVGATYKWAPSAKLSNTVTSGGLTWDIELTGKGTFGNMDSTKGAQIGSSKSPVDTATFMTADYVDGITKVTVNTAGASSVVANIQVFVGDVELECEGSNALTTSNKDYVFTSSTVLTGTVKIIYTVSAKAIYFKSVTIN